MKRSRLDDIEDLAKGGVLFGPCPLSDEELEEFQLQSDEVEEFLVQFSVTSENKRINVDYFDAVDIDECESGEAGELPPGLASSNGEISIEPFHFAPPPRTKPTDFVVPKRKPRFYEKLDQSEQQALFDKIFDFLEESSPSADGKRASDKIHVVGLSIPKLKKKLAAELPHIWNKLGSVDAKSFRCLFTAPHQGRSAKSRYWGIISAKVARGQNNLHATSAFVLLNLSFCFGRITSLTLDSIYMPNFFSLVSRFKCEL